MQFRPTASIIGGKNKWASRTCTPVALDDTRDTYANGYLPVALTNGADSDCATAFRPELVQRVTTAYGPGGSLGSPIGQTLASKSYTYDNAGLRLTNTVATATVTSGGAVQYTGGSPTGAACIQASTQLRELRALLYIDDDSLPNPDEF